MGSRRLSVNDIGRLPARVPEQDAQGIVSYIGSHVLSLAYFTLYGRFISDTLSGARVVRSSFLRSRPFDYRQQEFQPGCCFQPSRQRAEVFKRRCTTPHFAGEGSPRQWSDRLRSLAAILRLRWSALPAAPAAHAAPRAETDPVVLPRDTVSLSK
jgi:hypothetical protein